MEPIFPRRSTRRRCSLRDEMFLSAWVLLCTLPIANLQRASTLRAPPTMILTKCKEYLINEHFVQYTVVRGPSTVIDYCKNQTLNRYYDPITTQQLIRLYTTFNFSQSFDHVTPDSPMKESGVLSINDHQELPLFIMAKIRSRHVRSTPYNGSEHDTDAQMVLMGKLTTDVRVCLLPYSLGGSRGSYVVPMAAKVYQLDPKSPTNFNDTNISEPPFPSWKSGEDWILKFLQTYPKGLVLLNVAVQYAERVVTDPRRLRVYRPLAFARQFTAYKKSNDKNSLFYESNQTTLLNNNDDSCGGAFRNDLPMIPMECTTEYVLNSSKGMGAVKSKDVWEKTNVVAFPFTIKGRTYFYGQLLMPGYRWFIRELLPDGQMGRKQSMGNRAFYYHIVFTYCIEERHYFYSHRGVGGTYWFIQELLEDGQTGSKTADGGWSYGHSVSIPFDIEGKQYFYGQIVSINKWFIQELLPEGKMGNVTGVGENFSPVVCISKGEYKQFLYSHEPVLLTWYTRELLPGGKMGPIIHNGEWDAPHHTCIPYSIRARTFFYGENLYTGDWFIRETLKDGKMGRKVSDGKMKDRYELVFTYVVEGKNFIYAHNQRSNEWNIRLLM